ncbi:unnamed protein product [Linum trigynum]|uniref:Uncharacterized protein n=1 Tax=Linum trigynum TaxID=586398 RepID=A0AAV2CEJ2_9ROSI
MGEHLTCTPPSPSTLRLRPSSPSSFSPSPNPNNRTPPDPLLLPRATVHRLPPPGASRRRHHLRHPSSRLNLEASDGSPRLLIVWEDNLAASWSPSPRLPLCRRQLPSACRRARWWSPVRPPSSRL